MKIKSFQLLVVGIVDLHWHVTVVLVNGNEISVMGMSGKVYLRERKC